MLLLSSNLQAGTVSINGHKQSGTLPLLMKGPDHGYVLTIDDTLTVDAPPFQPKTCHLKLPDALVPPWGPGTCQVLSLEDAAPMTLNGLSARPAYWVYLPFEASDSPADQQQAVGNLLTRTLTKEQQTLAPTGSFVATGADRSGAMTSQQTSVPLQASASLFPPLHLPPGLTYCGAPICPKGTPESALTLPAGVWSIGVGVALRWRFMTGSGTVVSDVPFPVVGLVSLLDSASGWRVIPPSTGDATLAAQRSAQFADLLCSTGMEMLARQAGTRAITLFHDRGVDGCELSLQTNREQTALFVWRFGVLLAANSSALTLLPRLPVASPADRMAVER